MKAGLVTLFRKQNKPHSAHIGGKKSLGASKQIAQRRRILLLFSVSFRGFPDQAIKVHLQTVIHQFNPNSISLPERRGARSDLTSFGIPGNHHGDIQIYSRNGMPLAYGRSFQLHEAKRPLRKFR